MNFQLFRAIFNLNFSEIKCFDLVIFLIKFSSTLTFYLEIAKFKNVLRFIVK